MKISIVQEPMEPWSLLAEYQSGGQLKPGSYGACASFIGTMRDFNEGDNVSAMTLEHYPGMTEQQLTVVASEAMQEHGLLDCMIVHRVGEIRPNDPIVVVAAWSAHRAAAFTACREIMENLKHKATFWKKETLPDSERWVDRNTPG